MATTGLPAGLTSSGISPPNPKRDSSVTPAASTVATPASKALPPWVRMRKPASTSKLFAAPTISCVPRTGGNMVCRGWAARGAASSRMQNNEGRRMRQPLQFIPVERLRDGNAYDFDAMEIGRADAVLLGQQQGVVARSKGRGAALGARIVTHDGGCDSVGRDGIGSSDQHPGLDETQRLRANPRAFAAGDGFDAVDDREIDRTRGDQVGYDVRHAITGIVIGAEVQLLWGGA